MFKSQTSVPCYQMHGVKIKYEAYDVRSMFTQKSLMYQSYRNRDAGTKSERLSRSRCYRPLIPHCPPHTIKVNTPRTSMQPNRSPSPQPSSPTPNYHPSPILTYCRRYSPTIAAPVTSRCHHRSSVCHTAYTQSHCTQHTPSHPHFPPYTAPYAPFSHIHYHGPAAQ